MLYILLICAALGLMAAITTGIVITRKVNSDDGFDYLLVLGSTVNGTAPSIMLSERIRAACDYLRTHEQVICIPTGAKNPDADIPEAVCIANELTAMGIDENRIWVEDQANSTRENLRFSRELIRQKTGRYPACIGVITSDFHAFRVRLTARRQGISASVMSVRSAHTIFYYPAFLREIIAVWYYLLFKKK